MVWPGAAGRTLEDGMGAPVGDAPALAGVLEQVVVLADELGPLQAQRLPGGGIAQVQREVAAADDPSRRFGVQQQVAAQMAGEHAGRAFEERAADGVPAFQCLAAALEHGVFGKQPGGLFSVVVVDVPCKCMHQPFTGLEPVVHAHPCLLRLPLWA